MKPYAEMTKEELVALRKDLKAKYHDFQTKDLRLDMSRGKPSADQLDLSMGMMDVLSSDDDLTCEDGTDCRNYGVLTGIDEAKELLADMMEVNPSTIIIYGNSSLNVMYRYGFKSHDPRNYGKYSMVQARIRSNSSARFLAMTATLELPSILALR